MLQAAALIVFNNDYWLPFVLLDGQKKIIFHTLPLHL